MDLQTALTGVSLAGAGFSTATTAYYWFARVRSERPRLSCELAERELFLGAMAADRRQLGVKLGLVIVNGSSLPNAVLRVRFSVAQRNGGWLEAERVAFDKTTPRPINVPAMQTSFLTVNGNLTFPYVTELEQSGNKTLLGYVDRFMTNPRRIRVELSGLNNERFENILSYEAAA
jgi:hypothetical protein